LRRQLERLVVLALPLAASGMVASAEPRGERQREEQVPQARSRVSAARVSGGTGSSVLW